MKPVGTLLLSRQEVAALLGINECIAGVEEAFKQHAEGKAPPPGIVGIHAQDGGFHIKAAMLHRGKPYFAAKVNANFFSKREAVRDAKHPGDHSALRRREWLSAGRNGFY